MDALVQVGAGAGVAGWRGWARAQRCTAQPRSGGRLDLRSVPCSACPGPRPPPRSGAPAPRPQASPRDARPPAAPSPPLRRAPQSANGGDIRLILGQLQMIRLRSRALSYDQVGWRLVCWNASACVGWMGGSYRMRLTAARARILHPHCAPARCTNHHARHR